MEISFFENFSKFVMQILCFHQIHGKIYRTKVLYIIIDLNIWFYIFLLALNFLKSLLEIDRRKRLIINKVFLQSWLQVENSCMNNVFLPFLYLINCMFNARVSFSYWSDLSSFASSQRWTSIGCCECTQTCFFWGVCMKVYSFFSMRFCFVWNNDNNLFA